MFSGFITTWMSYTTLSLAISFLPLGLFAVEKYTLGHNQRYLVILTLVYPLTFFSGHFQISIYLNIFIFAYILFKYVDSKNKNDLFNLSIFSFFGILLSMPQILPTLEFYFLSVRSTIFQKIEAVPIKDLITVISPDYDENPVTRNVNFGNYIEWASFSGSVTFFLALLSILKKNKYIIFFLITAIISLLLSLDTVITDLLIKLNIPVISTSALSRILVLFSFSISILSAFGLDLLVSEIKSRRKKQIINWFLLSTIILLGTIWILTIGKIIDAQNYQIAIKNLILPTALILLIFFIVFLSLLKNNLIKFALFLILILIIFDMLRFSIKWQVFSENKFVFPNSQIIKQLQLLDNPL